jgi:hypothetical protein
VPNCFEADWKNIKTIKLKKGDPDELKEVARKYYPMIKECYKL